MKSIGRNKKAGEPSKTTHRKALTEQGSANKDAAALSAKHLPTDAAFSKNFNLAKTEKTLAANANLLSNLIFKIHQTHNLFEDFEEEEAILESMEAADGWAA